MAQEGTPHTNLQYDLACGHPELAMQCAHSMAFTVKDQLEMSQKLTHLL